MWLEASVGGIFHVLPGRIGGEWNEIVNWSPAMASFCIPCSKTVKTLRH